MRSLLLICLWLLTSAVYAESCGSHLKKTETSGVATVECPGCTNLNDFASYGAAMLYSNNQYNRTYVTKGSTEVEVILRNSYRNTPFSFGMFGFSWNLRATNYAERLVDAFPRRGSVNGAPWNRQPISTISLNAKCKEIEELKKEESAPAPRRGSVSEGAYDTDAYWRSGNPHDLYGGRSYERGSQPRTIVRTESCGTERCPSWDAPPELVRSGVDSWYVDWQPPSRETRITTEEIRGGGGRSRSTRTNSTGLGPGAGPDPGKAKEH